MYIVTKFIYLNADRPYFTFDNLDLPAYIDGNLSNKVRENYYDLVRIDLYDIINKKLITDLTLKQFMTYENVLFCSVTIFGYRIIRYDMLSWKFLDIVDEPKILSENIRIKFERQYKPLDDTYAVWLRPDNVPVTILDLYRVMIDYDKDADYFITGFDKDIKYEFKITSEIKNFITKTSVLGRKSDEKSRRYSI